MLDDIPNYGFIYHMYTGKVGLMVNIDHLACHLTNAKEVHND